MTYPDHKDREGLPSSHIDHTPITHPQPVTFDAGQLLHIVVGCVRIAGERRYLRPDASRGKAMEGLLEPVYEERLAGRARVIQLFNISRVGVIAGSMVYEGKILRGSRVHVVREGKVIHEGEIASLKRVKDDVKEVASGFDCGITVTGFKDFMINDVIESYTVEKVTAHL